MGNPIFDKGKNIVTIHHAVPGLKMKGLDNPDITYELQHFTEMIFHRIREKKLL